MTSPTSERTVSGRVLSAATLPRPGNCSGIMAKNGPFGGITRDRAIRTRRRYALWPGQPDATPPAGAGSSRRSLASNRHPRRGSPSRRARRPRSSSEKVHSKTDWALGLTSFKARDFLSGIEVGKLGKLGELGKDGELDGAELLRDALSPPLALTPNRHPLRGYSARRRQERGLFTLPRLLPSPRSERRRAGDEGGTYRHC